MGTSEALAQRARGTAMPIKRPRVHRVALAAVLTLFALIVLSCGPGAQDYTYPVAGQYALHRTSRDRILIQYDGPAPYPPNTDIDPKVVALNWNERYVLVKQQRSNGKGELIAGVFDWW